jgi:hypothetical protein
MQHPQAPRAIVVLAMVLALPTLAVGFFADDYAFLIELKHLLPNGPPWCYLYR